MNKLKKLFALLFVSGVLISGCEDDNQPIDPQRAIIGKWEIIENSFGPVSYPGSYTEFRPDSVLYDYVGKGDSSYSKYWFADSLLYKSHIYLDQTSGDTILVSTIPYRFEFITHNKLELEIQVPAQISTFIYKRLK